MANPYLMLFVPANRPARFAKAACCFLDDVTVHEHPARQRNELYTVSCANELGSHHDGADNCIMETQRNLTSWHASCQIVKHSLHGR